MNLYLISQTFNHDYDTYSSAVVCAETKEEARHTHPCNILPEFAINQNENRQDYQPVFWDGAGQCWSDQGGEWVTPDLVVVELVGVASPGVGKGVVCASYHAG
jgi:hypothetical protein